MRKAAQKSKGSNNIPYFLLHPARIFSAPIEASRQSDIFLIEEGQGLPVSAFLRSGRRWVRGYLELAPGKGGQPLTWRPAYGKRGILSLVSPVKVESTSEVTGRTRLQIKASLFRILTLSGPVPIEVAVPSADIRTVREMVNRANAC